MREMDNSKNQMIKNMIWRNEPLNLSFEFELNFDFCYLSL